MFAAVGARVWDAAVGVVGRAGQNYPREWLAALAERGIDVRGVRWLDGEAEMRTFFAHDDGGSRDEGGPAFHFGRLGLAVPPELATYHQPTADQADAAYRPLWLHVADIPPAYQDARGFHLAPMNFESHLELSEYLRRVSDGVIALDPGESYMTPQRLADVEKLLRSVDVFLPSEMEVATLLPDASADEAARWFAARGPRLVVVKRGARGSLVYDRDRNAISPVPPCPATVRDVTGAGDAFCGAFLAGLVETGDPLAAAQRGAVSASFIVEDFGALYALRYARGDAERRLEGGGRSG